MLKQCGNTATTASQICVLGTSTGGYQQTNICESETECCVGPQNFAHKQLCFHCDTKEIPNFQMYVKFTNGIT